MIRSTNLCLAFQGRPDQFLAQGDR